MNEPLPPLPNDGPPDRILTLANETSAEIKVRRSRFIGLACPAPDTEAARRFVAESARRYHDARHVCHAWRLGSPPATTENRNDAGEPSGTAGEPILTALRKADLVDCVAVVVRYFGGVKLGTGGLSRAYGQTAEAALAAGTVRTVLLGREFDIGFPYNLQKTVGHLLEQHGGRVESEQYAATVKWRLWLPHSTWRTFGAALFEASSGRVELPAPKE